jgi:hypothetical protein
MHYQARVPFTNSLSGSIAESSHCSAVDVKYIVNFCSSTEFLLLAYKVYESIIIYR